LHGAKPINFAVDVVVAVDQAYVFHFGAHFDHGARTLELQVFDQDATRVMPKPELTTTAGGSVLVRSVQDQWIPEVAVYKVTFELVDQQWQSPQINLRGTVVVHGAWSIPFSNFAKQVMSVLVREFGF
jgi:hypothetical protein